MYTRKEYPRLYNTWRAMKGRYDTAYLYWLSVKGDITGTKLGAMFGVSFGIGCRWIRKFKKEINDKH